MWESSVCVIILTATRGRQKFTAGLNIIFKAAVGRILRVLFGKNVVTPFQL